MAWNGYRDDETDVGDGWEAIENCSLYIQGECRRRLGFGAKVDLASIGWSAAEMGSYAVIATSAGGIKSVHQTTGSVASLATGLTATQRPTFASMSSRLYYANGTEARAIDSGVSTARTIGIVAPSVAPTATGTGSGSVDTGLHLIRYRYYDSTRNRYSNPSDVVSVTTTAGQTIDVTYTASGDATVTSIIIEMTAVGAETYYRAKTIANSGSTTNVNISDANLIVQIAASRDGEFGHDQPPATYDILCEHRQRLWLWDIATGTLAWSRALFPESWDQTNYARAITLDAGDTPTAMSSFYTDMYLFGTRSMRRLIYSSDPAAAMVSDIPGNFGCFNARCVIKIDGGVLVGWGRNGMWMIDAMQPKKISRRVDATLESLMDASNTTAQFIVYEPERREVLFFFPLSGETYCKRALCWSLDTQEWTLYAYRQPITFGVLNTAYTDRQRLMIGDSNNYLWRVGVAANDGGGAGVVTVTSGSTTSVINGTNTAVVGQTLYVPSTGEERLITVASGSQITVGTPLSAAPTAGMEVYVGSIRQRIMTDWNPGEGMNYAKRPDKFLIAIRPDDDMGDGQVNFYQDFSATAVPATAFAADVYPEGVSVAANVISLDFDAGATDGFIPVPTPGDWKRVIRAEVIAETPLDGVRFLDASFRGNNTKPSEET
jgi:hypothetical protein